MYCCCCLLGFSCCCVGCFRCVRCFFFCCVECSVGCLLSAGFGFDGFVVSVCLRFVFMVPGGLLVVISVCCIVLRCVSFCGSVLFLGCLGAILLLCCVVSGLFGVLLCCSSERRKVIPLFVLGITPFFFFGVVLKKFCTALCGT